MEIISLTAFLRTPSGSPVSEVPLLLLSFLYLECHTIIGKLSTLSQHGREPWLYSPRMPDSGISAQLGDVVSKLGFRSPSKCPKHEATGCWGSSSVSFSTFLFPRKFLFPELRADNPRHSGISLLSISFLLVSPRPQLCKGSRHLCPWQGHSPSLFVLSWGLAGHEIPVQEPVPRHPSQDHSRRRAAVLQKVALPVNSHRGPGFVFPAQLCSHQCKKSARRARNPRASGRKPTSDWDGSVDVPAGCYFRCSQQDTWLLSQKHVIQGPVGGQDSGPNGPLLPDLAQFYL